MKKIFYAFLILCMAVFTGCGTEKETKIYNENTTSVENTNIKADDVLIKAIIDEGYEASI